MIKHSLSTLKCSSIIAVLYVLASSLVGCYQKIDTFSPRQITGRVDFSQAIEISGAVASRAHPGLLWVHNDSGDTARLFALNPSGAHLGEFHLEGIDATDWEDITISRDPNTGKEILYIGDIGDNNSTRASVTIHKVIDPWTTAINGVVPTRAISSTTFTYPDQPRDAEALLIDPWTHELYILTKREMNQILYRVPTDVPTGSIGIAEKIVTLPTPPIGSIRDHIVAADISPDGDEIIIKTYLQMLYWQRENHQSLADTLVKEPMSAPYAVERQGEAIAWDAEGLGYFSIPESNNPTISYYGKK